jgi:hypothetical protein
MMGMEIVPEVLISFDQLTQMLHQEDRVEFGHFESFESRIILY